MHKGLAAAQARDASEAAVWFGRAVEAEPSDPTARAWLGQSLCSLGRRLEGTAHLRRAASDLLASADISGHLDQALETIAQLQHWSDFDGALDLARRAVELAPAHPRAQQLLAVTCGQLNLTEAALAAGEAALALAPDQLMMQVLQGSLEADAGRFEDAEQRLATLLLRRPPDREAFRAHKEMARIVEALGDDEDVFPHLDAAAALAPRLPEHQAQNPALIPNLIRANLGAYDPELLGRWAGAEFPEPSRPRHAFVVGFFRSGTTLTQEVLGAHPDVFVADEANLVWEMQRELHRIDPSAAPVAAKLARLDLAGIARLRQAYWDAARARYGADIDKPVFVDKFTMNTLDLGLINVVFPEAQVIFVMRDPRDVCLSCYTQLMVPSPATVHLLDWRETARFYGQVMDWWLHIRERLTLPVTEIRYEDAVAAFGPTFRRIFAALGLPWDPAVQDFHRNARGKFIASPSRNQVSRPLYGSSVARWRRHEGHFADVAEVLEPYVRAFGYEAV
jgi:tetratricopeptide (TPR) repeat protein